jgi:hypothetical protein
MKSTVVPVDADQCRDEGLRAAIVTGGGVRPMETLRRIPILNSPGWGFYLSGTVKLTEKALRNRRD